MWRLERAHKLENKYEKNAIYIYMRKKSEVSAAETCTITRVVNFYIASGRIFYVMTFGDFGACGLMKTSIFTLNNSDEDNRYLTTTLNIRRKPNFHASIVNPKSKIRLNLFVYWMEKMLCLVFFFESAPPLTSQNCFVRFECRGRSPFFRVKQERQTLNEIQYEPRLKRWAF